jgi:hypothetical protein
MSRKKVTKEDLQAKAAELRGASGLAFFVEFRGFGKPRLVAREDGEGRPKFSGPGQYVTKEIIATTSAPLLLERMNTLANGLALGIEAAGALVFTSGRNRDPLPEEFGFCPACGLLLFAKVDAPSGTFDRRESHECKA